MPVLGPGTEVPSNLSAVGLAHEVTFNTPVVPSQFDPFTQCSLMPEPGLFYPQTMMNIRETDVFPLYGQEKLAGALDSPLFPVNGILAWIAAVGSDAYQSGSTTATVTGTITPVAAGVTSLSWAAVTGVPLANMFIQISGSVAGTFGPSVVNAATAAAPAFIVKPTVVTGAGPYTLTVPAIPYAITVLNQKAQSVVAPFFHGVAPQNRPISLTLEKNIGGFESEQYSGCMVNTYALKLPTTNAEASFSADIMAAGVATLSTPTTVAGIDQEVPFVFAEGALSLFGQSLTTVNNVTLNLGNTVKDTYTVGNTHLPAYLTPTTRTLSGSLTVVFYSLDDPTYGYFKASLPSTATAGSPTQGALSLTLTHPGTNGSFFINIPQINIEKIADEIRIGDVVMQTLDFHASYSIASGYMLQSYFSNGTATGYLPY
jgi:Phage tail tube protein